MIPLRVTQLVHDAIEHAKTKHPGRTIDCQPNRDTRLRILAEEVGEVAAECQDLAEADDGEAFISAGAQHRAIESARHRLIGELAQVAACTLLWLADEVLHVAPSGEGGE